jgi:hypothetical protein
VKYHRTPQEKRKISFLNGLKDKTGNCLFQPEMGKEAKSIIFFKAVWLAA